MALTKTTVAVDNISSLSSTPNSTEGLTAAQLQAKFDKTGSDLKTYINDTLTEEIDTILGDVTAADIDKLHDITASAAEINLLDAKTYFPNSLSAKMTTTNDDSFATATNVVITFNTQTFNNGLTVDTANNRITIPAGCGGVYLITGLIYYTANATGRRFCNILKNGTQVVVNSVDKSTNTTTYVSTLGLMTLADGDYIQLQGYQDSGSTLTSSKVWNYLAVVRLF